MGYVYLTKLHIVNRPALAQAGAGRDLRAIALAIDR